MDHFKQTESFIDLYNFDQPILSGGEQDPFAGDNLQRQFTDCAGGSCSVENYRNDSGILNNIHQESSQFGNGNNDAFAFGNGGIGDVRQDIGHAIRPGFGRGVGNFYARPERRKFNRHFQRGCYTGNGYSYEKGMPNSYYPSRHTNWDPYSYNYDPYPYYQQQQPQEPPRSPPPPVIPQPQNFPTVEKHSVPGMPWVPILIVITFFILLLNTEL